MVDSKPLKDHQGIVDAFKNYFSSIIDEISKNNIDNRINDEILSTFHYYLEQNYFHPCFFGFYNFLNQKIKSVMKSLKMKSFHVYDEY